MIEVNPPNSSKDYDKMYLLYSKKALIFVKYAGIFTEVILAEGEYSNKNATYRWFELTKDEILQHIVLEKVSQTI
jgi:hypothetical protein